MKLIARILCLFFALYSLEVKADNLTLWYNSPASAWEEALPVGNGRLGAMVFGYTDCERIQFNENTLYSGGPEKSFDISVQSKLNEVRRLLESGKNNEADSIIQNQWIGRLNEAYQPCGDLYIDFKDKGNITDYVHSLDMAKAVVKTDYRINNVHVKREVFASYPAQAIIIKLSAEKPILDFDAYISSEHPYKLVSTDNNIYIKGQAPAHAQRRDIAHMRTFKTERLHPEYFDSEKNVIREEHIIYGDGLDDRGTLFEACLDVLSHNGNVFIENDTLKVDACSEIVFMIYAATSYNGFDNSPVMAGKNPHKLVQSVMKKNEGKNYDELYKEHISDYIALFNRVSLELPASDKQKSLPTDERLKRFHETEDQMLLAQLFQFGRYLMISGSRPGGQPLNLQGLWNDKRLPPWNSGYTLNINLEMNYWPAEVTNLSECHMPLFKFIEEISEKGKRIARNMYGLDGWAIHHNISIWREGYPSDGYVYWFFWNTSGAWLCSHIWEHYLYTEDKEFLNKYYDILKGASVFYSEWLVKDKDGRWVTPVSTSPENAYIMSNGLEASVCPGSTMDQALIRNLFDITIKASKILGIDEQFRFLLRDKVSNMAGYKIGSKGQLLEWDKEYTEKEPNHRHVSHLFGLYPGCEITSDKEDIFNAARKSLYDRGNKTTGWSMAWKVSLWARLYDASKSYEALTNLVNYVDVNKKAENSGGLYRNMLNALPFQIDGNFGVTAGIAEMLLQSHNNNIHLLPALPKSWKNGEVKGLKARGGYTVDIKWKDGNLEFAKIKSENNKNISICYNGRIQSQKFKKNEVKIIIF